MCRPSGASIGGRAVDCQRALIELVDGAVALLNSYVVEIILRRDVCIGGRERDGRDASRGVGVTGHGLGKGRVRIVSGGVVLACLRREVDRRTGNRSSGAVLVVVDG